MDLPTNNAAWLFFLICLVGGLAVYNAIEVQAILSEVGMVAGLPGKVDNIRHNIAVICTQLGAPCVF